MGPRSSGSTGPTSHYLSVGSSSGSGTLLITGGSLSATLQYVGDYGGNGLVVQSGGVNSGELLFLGQAVGSSGTYNLTGGLQSCGEVMTGGGAAQFTQSGGTNSTSDLILGNFGSTGSPIQVYSLSGSGILSAGYESLWGGNGSGVFKQSGGMNAATFLAIGTSSTYSFTGGTLQVSGGLQNKGIFDGGEAAGTLTLRGSVILDFTTGSIVNTEAMSLAVGANSLVLVAPALIRRASSAPIPMPA